MRESSFQGRGTCRLPLPRSLGQLCGAFLVLRCHGRCGSPAWLCLQLETHNDFLAGPCFVETHWRYVVFSVVLPLVRTIVVRHGPSLVRWWVCLWRFLHCLGPWADRFPVCWFALCTLRGALLVFIYIYIDNCTRSPQRRAAGCLFLWRLGGSSLPLLVPGASSAPAAIRDWVCSLLSARASVCGLAPIQSLA